MHDALVGSTHREVGDAELGGVDAQRVDLLGRDLVRDRLVDVLGRDVVVLGGEVSRGAAPCAASAQAVERLRAGDLVHEVEVDVDAGRVRRAPDGDQVALPQLWRARWSVVPRGGVGSSVRSLLSSHFIWDTLLADMDIVTGVGVLDKAPPTCCAPIAELPPRSLHAAAGVPPSCPRATAHRLALGLGGARPAAPR